MPTQTIFPMLTKKPYSSMLIRDHSAATAFGARLLAEPSTAVTCRESGSRKQSHGSLGVLGCLLQEFRFEAGRAGHCRTSKIVPASRCAEVAEGSLDLSVVILSPYMRFEACTTTE
jgi:hypothetical protein